MEVLPLLYKQDSKGKIRTYCIEIEGADYRMVTGLLGGKQTRTKWTTAKPKNSGKANATSGEEQAKLEAQARYTKKRGEHMHDDIANAKAVKHSFFATMLANTAKVAKFEMTDDKEVILDPKLDGMRLTTDNEGYRSRKGKPVPSAQFIYTKLKKFLEENPTVTLDGELYNHDYADDFQSLMKVARRTKLSDADKILADKVLEFHIYDMKDSDVPEMTCLERKLWLDASGLADIAKIKIVRWDIVNTIEDFNNITDEHLEAGYEGSIVRIMDAPYTHKKCNYLIKYKQFEDAEYEILEVLPGKGNRSDIAGSIVVKIDDTITCGCGIKGSWEYSSKLLINQSTIIGQQATVRYFGFTNDGKLRFPVVVDINRPD